MKQFIFTAPESPSGVATVVLRPASRLGEKLLGALADENIVQQLAIFRVHERCAYGMTQAFTTANDVTYSAAVSVAKAAGAQASRFDSSPDSLFLRPQGLRINIKPCDIVLPVIVIDGLLYEVFLQEDNNVCVKSVSSGTLIWRNPIGGHKLTIIRVMVKDVVDRFAQEAAVSIYDFFDLCREPLARFRAESD